MVEPSDNLQAVFEKALETAPDDVDTLKALREGLEEYDRRHGWRGPLTNISKDNWKKN